MRTTDASLVQVGVAGTGSVIVSGPDGVRWDSARLSRVAPDVVFRDMQFHVRFDTDPDSHAPRAIVLDGSGRLLRTVSGAPLADMARTLERYAAFA